MNLGKHYSKAIINKFDYIPVYLPDTKIRPGAILSFGSDFWGINDPVGSFDVIGNLINGETFNFPLKVGNYPSKASYNFISQNEVSVSSKVNANVPNITSGSVQFNFAKEGSILLYALRPTESRLEDHIQLKKNLAQVVDDFEWDDHYIVTSVITCEKALVFQSNDRDGSLVVDVNVPAVGVNGTELKVDANVTFDVKWKDKQALSVDWADDVVLFMKLARYKKKDIKKNINKGMPLDGKIEGAFGVEENDHKASYDLIEVDVNGLREKKALEH